MQISPSRIFGNCGAAGPPERLTKSDGIKTLVRKLRLCQSARGRSRTRVESRSRGILAPSDEGWRTTFRRLFFGKRIGTTPPRYDSRYSEAKSFAVLPGGTSATGRTHRGEPVATGKLITAEFRVELSA